MRIYRIMAVLLFILMLTIPSICMILFETKEKTPQQNSELKVSDDVFDMEISLYRTKTDTVEKIKCYDYICSVVAGEMQANYHSEALKAQTVAAFTYTINKMNYVKENPDTDIGHNGAYVCDDYSHCKAYLDKESAKSKWGDEWYDKYYPNIEKSVSSVLGEIITVDGQPINAVFHAISNGITCSAEEVWGTAIPYLKSVECAADKDAQGYKTTFEVSFDDFIKTFKNQMNILIPENRDEWLFEINYYDSGMVKEFNVAGTSYDGTVIRKMFSLRSSTFEVDLTDSAVIFTVYGYGHGVGMSQHGANEMAKSGKTYKEILQHFYTDTEIQHYKI